MKLVDNRKLHIALLLSLLGIALGIVVKTNWFYRFDLVVSQLFQAMQPLWLIRLNKLLSFFDIGAIFLVVPLYIYLRLKGHPKEANIVLLSLLSWFLIRILKTGFGIMRPSGDEVALYGLIPSYITIEHPVITFIRQVIDSSYSYPSGHVATSVSILGALILVRQKIATHQVVRDILCILPLSVIILMGQSRVSLGAHWFTDIIGGYLFGIAYLFWLWSLYAPNQKKK
jgi:membrane-associated phospholipid phosphatase